jgi:hemolysin activation/secretion protein
MQFGKVKAGIAYAKLNYHLGEDFSSLGANGTARITSLYGSYPLIRSRTTNFYARLAFDAKTFEDKVDSTATATDKKAQVGMASLNGEHRDGFGGGGVSSVALTWTHGQIDIRTPAALAIDAATVHTDGDFDKFTFTAQRLQNVSQTLSLYGAVSGQFASANLDISEKMGLGGAYAVRAYPSGEAYGDHGYVLNLEARALLPKFTEQLPGQMQLVGFVDTGTVTLNKNSFAPGDDRKTLSGTGIGISWSSTNDVLVKAYWAHKLGNDVATSAPDKANRFWIQAVKFF